jgi:cytochrome P450
MDHRPISAGISYNHHLMDAEPRNSTIGGFVTLDALAIDPYPIYARMQAEEPISWVPALNMYYVVKYEHVQAMLSDRERFAVGTENSTLFDTFGRHMLTVDTADHDRYRKEFASSMTPAAVRTHLTEAITRHVDALIDEFAAGSRAEMRASFAARLPILTMLSLFGIPLRYEAAVRTWYDSFEAALANFRWDAGVRATARQNVASFREMIRAVGIRFGANPDPGALLSRLIHSKSRLDDAELEQNSLIVFFGGISTVEALILNTLHALGLHSAVLRQLRADGREMSAVLDETIRWSGPVQSATRHVVADTSFAGIQLREGDIVNCMIAAANRDPAKFADPDRFHISRPELRHHLGFAAGSHHCLGSHLAKLEARIALERLLCRLPDFRVKIEKECAPYGSEFRKPRQLELQWN